MAGNIGQIRGPNSACAKKSSSFFPGYFLLNFLETPGVSLANLCFLLGGFSTKYLGSISWANQREQVGKNLEDAAAR